MRSGAVRVLAWAILVVASAYFLIPLWATVQFSLTTQSGGVFSAYTGIFADGQFWHGAGFSFVAALATVAIGLAITVPAVYWSHLKAPRMRPWIELVSLLSFVVPPIVLVFGIVRLYSGAVWPLSLRSVMLLGAYVVVSLPYLFRAIDNGLRSVHAPVLTEAAQSLGAGWIYLLATVIVPSLRTAMLGGAFLTFALIMGEFAIASMLGFNNLGVYMLVTGQNQAQGAAALAVLAFLLVWATFSVLHLFARGNVAIGGGAR